ncbi:MAG TPA: N,N-dimethylformamidase beta subunit family domain-containing protein [Mucilaginibacter sp.]|jgi:hypothetical protein
MPSPIIKRRRFLSSLFVIFILSCCKKFTKSDLSSNSPNKGDSNTSPSADYLGEYNVTELANGAYTLPAYFDLLTCGYSDKISYQPGDAVTLYLTGPKNDNKTIFLTDADNSEVFSFPTTIAPQQMNAPKPWVDGYSFTKSVTVNLPRNLKSGYYKWKLGDIVHEVIPLICKKDVSLVSDITVIYPSNTDNAYNLGGGKSLYFGPELTNRSTVASFSRYSLYPGDWTSSFLKWMNLQDYNVNYLADTDLEKYEYIQNSKVVIVIGHSEYWTRQARENIDKFVDSGKNLLVLSGNTMWWQMRYNEKKNLMICYKDTGLDPLSNTLYETKNWPQSSLNYSTIKSIGVDWNGGGYANKLTNRWNGFKIVNEKSPLFKGTGLQNGDILKLPSIEVDGAPVVKMILPGSDEVPVIDNSRLNFNKVELLAYDFATDGPEANGLGTFIVFKKTQSSGTVVNVATMNWCSPTGMGGDDGLKIQTITKNMIDRSLNNESLLT